MSGHVIGVAVLVSCLYLSAATAAIPSVERDALIDLYNATGGDDWVDRTGWLGPPGTECSWFGVGCDPGDDYVIHVWLRSNNLVGTIPSTLSAIEYLGWLRLDGNPGLSGPIPAELGDLSYLGRLDLGGDSLTGPIPDALCNASQLNELMLPYNELTGTIPPCVWGLVSLQELDLRGNNLLGTLPHPLTIASLGLRELRLSFNALSGTIPSFTGNTGSLEVLDLAGNLFSGPLPAGLGELVNLTDLDIGYNRLAGTVPPEIMQLTSITPGHLVIQDNGLDTTDPVVEAFLETHQTGWRDDQTVPPIDVTQTGATDTSVTVGWTPRGRLRSDSFVELQVAPEGTNDWRTVDRSPLVGLDAWTIHGLEPDSRYRLRIRIVADRRRTYSLYWCDLQPQLDSVESPEILVATAAGDQSWYVAAGAPPGGDCQSPANPCSTIQQAVDLAAPHDRVVVAPGVYLDPLTISRSVHVLGDGGGAVIDTRGNGRSVTIGGGGQVRLEGLTIRGGPAEIGGAILVDGMSLLQLVRCRIEGSSGDRGAGIAVAWGSTALIDASRLSDNVASDAGGAVASEGTAIIRDSEIVDNTALRGGGLAQLNFRMRVYDTTITGNEADVGGGLWVGYGTMYVRGSAAVANLAHHGAGIAVISESGGFGGTTAVLDASTISGNMGGAVLSAWTPDVCLADMTIIGNTPWQSSESGVTGWRGILATGTVISGNLPLDCNGSVKSLGFNADGDGSCGLGAATDQVGIEPVLSTLGHYGGRTLSHTPLPGSPLIDAGDPRSVRDQTGRDRLVDGSGLGWGAPDIGSIEAVGAIFIDGFEAGDTSWWSAVVGVR